MSLARIQFLSLATKGVTTVLGVAQSIIIIRILSPAEFGLVGLVMSIGGVIGVTQHLGIVDGAIREIAVLRQKKDIGTVFWVSHLVRQLVTLPLSLLLFLLAGFLAVRVYHHPEIVPYIQLFAAVLILQGVQDVLGATLTGLKKFGALYATQIVTATLNIIIFGVLTWQFSITGFFWAIIITTSLMILFLGAVVGKSLRGSLAWPKFTSLKKYGGNIMRLGAYMYVARIAFVVWQRMPLLVLGGVLTAEELGYLNASLTFGSKLTIVGMALSEVNLAWMSSLFAQQRDEFISVVTRNMQRVFVLMMGLALLLLFFTPEILRYVIGPQYLPAHDIIIVMTVAFFLYSLIDIGTSSVFVSANQPRLRAGIYLLLTALTGGVMVWLLLVRPDVFLASVGVLLGAIGSYIAMVWWARKFFVPLLTPTLSIFLVILSLSAIWLLQTPQLGWRLLVFSLIFAFVSYSAIRQRLVNLPTPATSSQSPKRMILYFAGAFFDQPTWTNRQHIASRVAQRYPLLYIEPRVWIFRYLWSNWRDPSKLWRFIRRLVWFETQDDLWVVAQWNLIPGSREIQLIAWLNHALNRWCIQLKVLVFGFNQAKQVLWILDTEAAEYLSAFPQAKVIYDCVDDHGAQAGLDRNSNRVKQEEQRLLSRADLVTVTSTRLLTQKKSDNANTHLVLNAGDVKAFQQAKSNNKLSGLSAPIIGSVGALDSYKFDFELIHRTAVEHPEWQFVFLGAPVVERKQKWLAELAALSNVHVLGQIKRQEVPGYVAQFSVCLIPYRDNVYNRASFPLKFWEFAAAGKPIVVTGLPELKLFLPRSLYAENQSSFGQAIQYALDHPEVSTELKEQAAEHSWDKRVERLLELVNKYL